MKDEYIGMTDILNLIDQKYGYAQDKDIIDLMKKSDIREDDQHLVGRRIMLRYFEYYKNNATGKNMIRDNEHGTKGTKYRKQDVIKVINDPLIKSKIDGQLKKKTIPGPFGPVPKCIFHQYIEEIIVGESVEEKEERENKEILALTGYTKSQIDLFSVPDELLLDRVKTVKNSICDLQKQIAKLQQELDDIDNEIQTRGLY